MAAAVAAFPKEVRPLSEHNTSLLAPSRASIASASPGSSSSSSSSLGDDEDYTITGKRTLKRANNSQDDLRLLAVSAQITEITYSISDIQTRIFEIQELRHQAQAESPSSSNASTAVIDQALINLDERLESVSRNIQIVEDTLEPVLRPVKTPTQSQCRSDETDTTLLRKHSSLMAEWEAVQNEAEVLRDELKEDKWLAVFRTVSEQADGMMASLEKAVTQCQDFIWQVQRQRDESKSTTSSAKSYRSDKNPINFEVYAALHNSFEAKKKYYMPSITKVLSVLDKGVRDRVTKNGECLRRHGDMRSRWRNLHDRIRRIDEEMEAARKILVNQDKEPEPSEASSTVSRLTSKSKQSSYLSTPSSVQSRTSSATSTIARSMSPIRKFAAKVTAGIKSGRGTPTLVQTPTGRAPPARTSASDPPIPARNRTSFFPFRSSHSSQAQTPEHTLETISRSPLARDHVDESTTMKPKKPRWNISPRIDKDLPPSQQPTIKRKPSANGLGGTYSGRSPLFPSPARSHTPSTQYNSSPSQPTSLPPSQPPERPPSRTVPRSHSPYGGTLPRPRPQTPSQIPVPSYLRSFGGSQYSAGSSDDMDSTQTSLMQRALSPSLSISTSGGGPTSPTSVLHRKASASRIPLPRFQINPASRPGSALSQYRSTSPALSANSSPNRAQTPETIVRARAQQMPFYQSSSQKPAPRPSTGAKAHAPSSFRDGSTPVPRLPPSRPSSRNATYDRSFTPSLEQNPVPYYVPAGSKDPLDLEVAKVVNGIAHGFLIERVDPVLKTAPHPGEEVKAQYAISNALGRKVVTCRLVVINRSGVRGSAEETQTRKVMCRVGGGWLDLQMYLLNRQAGLA